MYFGQVTRARRPEDWKTDLANARAVEREVAATLHQDRRISELVDATDGFDTLDFRFSYRGQVVWVDVKEKRQRYSSGIQGLRPEVAERDLFVVDETVFRRVVWQGGGGYLALHDLPSGRWCYFGPWELTLGAWRRYGRWGRRGKVPFLKGKLLLELASAASETEGFDVSELLRLVESARRWRDQLDPYPIHRANLRELGGT